MYQKLDQIEIPLFERFHFNPKKSIFENFRNSTVVAFDKTFANKRINSLDFANSSTLDASIPTHLYLEIDADTTISQEKYLVVLLYMFLDEFEAYYNNIVFNEIRITRC